jgi:hypothetical protein
MVLRLSAASLKQADKIPTDSGVNAIAVGEAASG